MKFSIIIPCYNEEKTIVQVCIDTVRAFGNADYEMIIVNDGSTDSSKVLVENYLSETPNDKLKLINLETNLGKTLAVREGIENAKGEYIAIHDADGEMDPTDLCKIIQKVKDENIKAMYGSRILKNIRYKYFCYYWGNRFITAIYNILFSDSLTDITNAFKVFDKSLIDTKKLTSKRFGICAQITCMLKKQNIKIVEFPVSYIPRSFNQGKKTRLKDGIELIWIILEQYLQK